MTQSRWHNRLGCAGVLSLVLALGMAATGLAADA
ncbi:MAG: peptidylprolyl isomerase, partial [Nitrospira sp. NTP1]|nr:peptidylprolyl isomerase [Nitrospira sp. NTP1]